MTMRCTSGLRHWSRNDAKPRDSIRTGSVSIAAAFNTSAVRSSSTASNAAWKRSVLDEKWWYMPPRLTDAASRISSVEVAAKPCSAKSRRAVATSRPRVASVRSACVGMGKLYMGFTNRLLVYIVLAMTTPTTSTTTKQIMERKIVTLGAGEIAYAETGAGPTAL